MVAVQDDLLQQTSVVLVPRLRVAGSCSAAVGGSSELTSEKSARLGLRSEISHDRVNQPLHILTRSFGAEGEVLGLLLTSDDLAFGFVRRG